jgi:hypothetical protein
MPRVLVPSEVADLTRRQIAKARKEVGLRIVYKRDSKLMKILFEVSLMRLWNPEFMTRYTTTIGSTMYLSRPVTSFGTGMIADLVLLNHEVQHIRDSKRWGGFVWGFLYLFPQSLAPLAFLGFIEPAFFAWALCVAPWPAPFRVWAEARAYGVSLATRKKMGLEVGPVFIES